MDIFIPAFVVFALVMLCMAVGVIFTGRVIQGSCGGLGNMKDERGRPLCECGTAEGGECTRLRFVRFVPGAQKTASLAVRLGLAPASPSEAGPAGEVETGTPDDRQPGITEPAPVRDGARVGGMTVPR